MPEYAAAKMADADPTEETADRPARRKKVKKKKAEAEPAPIPGAGTADGERLREALRAYEVGNFVLVRARTKALANADDPAVRDAAAELAARIGIDPVQIAVIIGCL